MYINSEETKSTFVGPAVDKCASYDDFLFYHCLYFRVDYFKELIHY